MSRATKPRCRRLFRRHRWITEGPAGIYGSWVRCIDCGERDLSW